MAKIFPERLPESVLSDPKRGEERKVYQALKSLPEKYPIFYSVHWVSHTDGWGLSEGEADFVIVHPDLGVLILEVKGWAIQYKAEVNQWFTRRSRIDGGGVLKHQGNQLRRRRWLRSTVAKYSREYEFSDTNKILKLFLIRLISINEIDENNFNQLAADLREYLCSDHAVDVHTTAERIANLHPEASLPFLYAMRYIGFQEGKSHEY